MPSPWAPFRRRFAADRPRPGYSAGQRRVGGRAPDIVGADLDGSELRLALSSPTPGRRVLLFLSSSCAPCKSIWSSLVPDPQVVVVVADRSTESIRDLRRLAVGSVTLTCSSAAWFDYDVAGAPWLVTVEGGFIEASGPPPLGWPDVVAALAGDSR